MCWLELCCKVGSRYIYLSYQLFPNHTVYSNRTPGVLVILAGLPGFSLLMVSCPIFLLVPVRLQLPLHALQ